MRYLTNLRMALMGRNPYKQELAEVRAMYEQASAAAASCESQLCGMNAAKVRAERSLNGCQSLVENLRKRVEEKDAQMDAQRQDYSRAVTTLREQHRLQREELEQKNQELRDDLEVTLEQLQRVNRDIGREMMSTNLLHKTNAALNDLCQAMASEDTDKMMAAVEYLDWSNPLSRIAQYHLNVLVRKKELEERMTLP